MDKETFDDQKDLSHLSISTEEMSINYTDEEICPWISN